MIKIQGRDTALLLMLNSCIPHQNNCTVHPSYINYHLMICCQLCLTHYTAVWINNCLKRTSAIEVANIKIMKKKLWIEANMCLPQNQHFLQWAKMNETQRRALVSPIVYTEVWSDIEQWKKSSLYSFTVMRVWRHQSVGRLVGRSVCWSVSQSVSQSVIQSVGQSVGRSGRQFVS